MNALAKVAELVDSGINAIGVTLINCDNGSQVQRTIAVPTDLGGGFQLWRT